MALLLAAIAQTITASPVEQIDLTVRDPCDSRKSDEEEIVICARRNGGHSPYRINQPLPRQSGLPKAELELADGVSASAETESTDVGGFPSNRAMIRVKIKF